jgi:hypothetical protein
MAVVMVVQLTEVALALAAILVMAGQVFHSTIMVMLALVVVVVVGLLLVAVAELLLAVVAAALVF